MRLRLPLPVTLGLTTALLALPAAVLLSVPRRTAMGLERLLPVAALLQSFSAQGGQTPPPLWQQRLGAPLASRLWAGQRRLWWQMWGAHGDAGAYLVLPAPPAQPLPPNGLRIDDLLVVAPDPLARQLLADQLKARRRAPRGLAQRCISQLRQREAVHWSAGALGQMLGPLAPLAQDLQQGCLLLSGAGAQLRWQGEADASEGSLAPPPAPLAAASPQPLAAPDLLELRGGGLDLLLRGLLSSAVLRRSLAQPYGLGPAPLAVLRSRPFLLRLRAEPKGPFRAGLELQLVAGDGRAALERWLVELSAALRDQGLGQTQPVPGLTAWSREDGTLVGGWRWLPGRQQLLLFLGPVPTRLPASPPLEQASWRLRLRPAAMAQAGLLSPELPPVVRRAQRLNLSGRAAGQRSGERQSSLGGWLDLR